jgi:F-type H+-transporting ATPase subunit delta
MTSGAAGRYATALFDLAKDAGALDQSETDLTALGAALEESDELSDLIRNPVYSRDEQGAAMAAIADKMGLSPLIKNVIGLMATKRRLFAVPELIEVFQSLMADHRGEVTADVTAAHPLSDTQATALVAKIKAAMGREVKLNVTVDEDIIGGLVVKVGSKMIDSSIRSKLTSLQNAMKEVG